MATRRRRRHGMLGKGSGSASSIDRLLRKGRDGCCCITTATGQHLTVGWPTPTFGSTRRLITCPTDVSRAMVVSRNVSRVGPVQQPGERAKSSRRYEADRFAVAPARQHTRRLGHWNLLVGLGPGSPAARFGRPGNRYAGVPCVMGRKRCVSRRQVDRYASILNEIGTNTHKEFWFQK